jgi:hypothetical protein
MDTIEKGSVWSGSNGRTFQVITEVEIEGHTWIHYRQLDRKTEEPTEYSCYKESFLSRFCKLPAN